LGVVSFLSAVGNQTEDIFTNAFYICFVERQKITGGIMRKSILLCLAIVCLVVLSGCRETTPDSVAQIAHVELTAEQEMIVDLIGSHDIDMYLFEFSTNGMFSEIGFRLLIYEYGELVENMGGLRMMSFDEYPEGIIALTVAEDREEGTITLRVSITWDFGRATGAAGIVTRPEDTLGWSFAPMNNPVAINGDTEVVLYVQRFTTTGVMHTLSDLQSYLDPDNFQEEGHVHVLIAEFIR
jgi:hypothetical protein